MYLNRVAPTLSLLLTSCTLTLMCTLSSDVLHMAIVKRRVLGCRIPDDASVIPIPVLCRSFAACCNWPIATTYMYLVKLIVLHSMLQHYTNVNRNLATVVPRCNGRAVSQVDAGKRKRTR